MAHLVNTQPMPGEARTREGRGAFYGALDLLRDFYCPEEGASHERQGG
jgi:hypothetical protein